MTALDACAKIEGAINDLHEETFTSEWDWSYTKSQSDADHLSDHKETLDKTRSHFALDENTSMWFVSTTKGGSNSILALCGNSPSAESRARYISQVNPQNLRLLIARLRELEGAPK